MLHLRRRRVDGDDVGEVVVHVVQPVAGDNPVHLLRLRPGPHFIKLFTAESYECS